MTQDQFWSLMASSKAASRGSFERQAKVLEQELSRLSPEEIVAFQRIFDEHFDRAYTWDLWGAAYILGGGCSDDGFMDFRSWLISMGRETYERALKDPESLADIPLGPAVEEDVFFEGLAYVASQVYEKKTGEEEMPDYERHSAEDPAGEEWDQDGDDLERRFPRLWAKYGSQV
jgi:hypothetical protein